jgi:hypothetical protein
MHTTLEARIEVNGEVRLLEPVKLSGSRRALVTVLEDEVLSNKPRVKSKHAGAFSSKNKDTSTRVDEWLEKLGFGQ